LKEFGNNLTRLVGFHNVQAVEVAEWTGMTASIFSKWVRGHREPSFRSAIAIGDFFGLSADRLARTPFVDLVGNELADVDRFERVEAEIRRRRKSKKKVPAIEAIRSPKETRAQQKSPATGKSQQSARERTRKEA
jgi:transcriptional regulator with XRE-family HTH domain